MQKRRERYLKAIFPLSGCLSESIDKLTAQEKKNGFFENKGKRRRILGECEFIENGGKAQDPDVNNEKEITQFAIGLEVILKQISN